MENIEETFGAVVRSLRQAAGMTQEQLAQALTGEGWATRQNTIAKLENGLRPTTIPELHAIAAVFEITPRELGALIWPPPAEDKDESAKFAMKHELALKRTEARAVESDLAKINAEMAHIQHRLLELREQIREMEEQIGEHPEA